MDEPTLLRVDLGDLYGELTVLERLDLTTGAVRFNVIGRRVAGAFLFTPDTDIDQAIPSKVTIQYGDGDRWARQSRHDLPVFNGVQLDGGTVIDPYATAGLSLRWRLNLRRPDTTWYQHTRFPDASAQHATTVIGALLDRWTHHPHRHDLLRAAARHDAQNRITRIFDKTITPGWQQVAEITADIDRAYSIVEQLRELLTS